MKHNDLGFSFFFLLFYLLNNGHNKKLKWVIVAKGGSGGGGGTTKIKSTGYLENITNLIFRNNKSFKYW